MLPLNTILLLSILFMLTTGILATYFWFSKDPSEYADACAYTVSFFMCALWFHNLYRFHKAKSDAVQVEFDQNATEAIEQGTVNVNKKKNDKKNNENDTEESAQDGGDGDTNLTKNDTE